ncbi:MAG: class I SAM-dependent methyltransferase [Chloroflexi bacterium]|nr:MAG: class I SAM-dependent methyltransferase [Chloroflexota bacterium]
MNPESLNHQYQNSNNLDARISLHERFSTNPYDWFLWVFDHLEIQPTARILEVGCGTGRLWVENRDRIPTEWEISLMDFSPGMTGQARQNTAPLIPDITFSVGNAMTLPFQAETFDAIIANHMLYHVPDREKALQEFYRCLKPKGRLYAATNGKDHMGELWELLCYFYPDTVWNSASAPFELENGKEQIKKVFRDVRILHYEDGLEITDADPLVNYIRSLSTMYGKEIYKESLSKMREEISEVINDKGAFFIRKSVGMFTASKG